MAVWMSCWCWAEVVEVKLVGSDVCGTSHLQVVFDGLEFFWVAGDEVEVGVVLAKCFAVSYAMAEVAPMIKSFGFS